MSSLGKTGKCVQRLQQKDEHNHICSLVGIEETANRILSEVECYRYNGATPIVKIAKKYGFEVYTVRAVSKQSGRGYIYENRKMILVNRAEDLFYQRMIIASEMGRYLFEHRERESQPLEQEKINAVYSGEKENKKEDLFARALLMPRELFLQQYQIARAVDGNMLFVYRYLSEFFEVPYEYIRIRLTEIFSEGVT